MSGNPIRRVFFELVDPDLLKDPLGAGWSKIAYLAAGGLLASYLSS